MGLGQRGFWLTNKSHKVYKIRSLGKRLPKLCVSRRFSVVATHKRVKFPFTGMARPLGGSGHRGRGGGGRGGVGVAGGGVFPGRLVRCGGQGAAAPATAAVTRQDLSATTPVTATLGYAGSYLVKSEARMCPLGSAAAAMILSWGRSGRWSLLWPNCISPSGAMAW